MQTTNAGALGLYQRLGFIRTDKMAKYYLNGGDAFRLKLVVDPELDYNKTDGDPPSH